MMTMLVGGALLPHPPILLPGVGQGREGEAAATLAACRRAAERIASWKPEVLVVMSPHAVGAAGAVTVNAADEVEGSLVAFGYPQLRQSWRGAPQLAQRLLRLAGRAGLPCEEASQPLDHGSLVPLFFLAQAGCQAQVLQLGFGASDRQGFYAFGAVLRQLVRAGAQRVAVIASGDLSHRLQPGAPAGFHPQAARFDEAVLQALAAGDAGQLLALPPALTSAAGECGLRPLLFLMGVFGEQPRVECLSYEAPFGVGYAVAVVQDDPRRTAPVDLAWESIRYYLRHRRLLPVPPQLPPDLAQPAAAFVSLKKHGALRGCMGTLEPVRQTVAAEIIANAVLASQQDPRFAPVRAEELWELRLSVDILAPPEAVAEEELDPRRYGVIVCCGQRRGLLLPALEGVDTVRQQVAIARQKAGILPEEAVELLRFEVRRYDG